MRNMQSTFDLTPFEKMNAPRYGSYDIGVITIPKGEELFGRTFYAIFGEKIHGLKILAWALCNSSKVVYLIQTPTITRWATLSNTPLFTSINDLVDGKNMLYTPLEWTYETFANIPTNLKLVNNSLTYNKGWEIKQSFYYSQKDGCVCTSSTRIEYLVGTPQGIFFGLKQAEGYYATKDECLLATFNGMEVVDFAEPTVIEIKIEIPSTEVVTRKLVLE